MKKIQLPIIFCFIAVLLSVLSCRKTDLVLQTSENSDASIKAKFFNDHRTNDPTEEKLVNFVKNKYANENIAEKIVKLVGFPRWDKISVYKDQNASLVNTSNTPTTYYIPLVIDSQNFVNAAMAIQASTTDTTLTYLQDWQYINLQNNNNSATDIAENYAVFFMRQDMNVFGNTSFKILDSNLFRFNNHKVDSVKLQPQVNLNNNNLVLVTTTCESVDISFNCSGGSAFNVNQNDNINNIDGKCHIYYDYCTSSSIEVGGGMPNGSPSGMPPSGGGGGGGGWSGVWTITPEEAAVMYVSSILNLDGLGWWFTAVPGRGARAIEMQNYLIANNSSPQSIALCNAHFNKMMSDPNYEVFVNSHTNDNIQNVFYAYQTEVVNEVTNPCLLSVISDIGISGFKSTFLNLFQDQIFSQNSPYVIKFKQSISVVGNNGDQVFAKNEPIVDLPNGKKQITITLNKTLLNTSVSKEYITAVIVHELVHSLLLINASPLSQEEQHIKFFNSYTVSIGKSVKELNPSLSDIDATALALEGIDDVTFPGGNMSTTRNNFAETNYGMGLIYAKNQANKYKNPTSGIGTYC